jgi:hypothetical protein
MMRALTLALVAAATLAAGCTKHQTEMILVITTEGVRIPEDVHKVHLTVADRQASLDDTVYEQDVELCNPMLETSCFNIPVTAALFPGKAHGSDSVRVEVDAIGAGGTVIADAALFTFADEQSLRLDFVLYANCLGNVECAKRDQACGPLDTCIDLKPGSANGGLDIALPRGPEDMSTPLPPDMTLVDLAGADLTQVPADLVSTLDMSGCANVTCDMGEQCVAGVCMPCGFETNPCCFGPVAPPPYHPNAGGGTGTGICYPTNNVCSGGYCVRCGNEGDPCCTMQTPACNGILLCDGTGTCVQPPVMDMSLGPDMTLMPSDMMMSTGGDLF